jgi:hypothetical protein
MCLSAGFLPVLMMRIVASLSSMTPRPTFLSRISSQTLRAGIPRVRIAMLMDTISASGVECDTQLCFFVLAASGMKECGPTIAKKAPEVDL